ncbi:class I adenylate-forming enzyme family protein [Actinomadura sp. 7K507]|uniref:class I adenylate-forming enzyme family protein n=1 Tax=Actinomadura sp. 7K507 TaxID=2530365 RepID=UPI00104C5F6C|nr:class I adenylate-forming enzyme family protein [Actinomadura sp. 7K507]TDC98398.1 long-chain fatty acid--CoA ligase [Actinomadura sp. 7K507]
MREFQTLVGPPPHEAAGIGALTLGGLLAEQSARVPGNEALVFDDPFRCGATVRWTYAELYRQARRVAKALVAAGIGKGARVGVLMGNRPEAVASLFGGALAGAVVVPLSTFSPKSELSYLLAHADLSVLLLQTAMGRRRFAADVAELCPAGTRPGAAVRDASYPYLRHVAVLGPAEHGCGIEPWERFLQRGDTIDDTLLDAVAAQVHPSDSGVVVYSSGTTDRPKGVLHNHQAVALQCWTQAQLFGRDESTRLWCALPLFWTAGLNAAMGATLAAGGTWVMQEMFEPGHALRLMERERVTEPHTLPHQAGALEEHPDWASTDLSSCTKVFGKSVFARHPAVTGDTGWNMPVGYGLSETCSFLTGHPSTTPRELLRKRSYGRLLPGNELRVVDPYTGQVLGPGEEGELAVRGPTLMEHYVKRTRAECFDPDGFFRTGDLGSYDTDGYVRFGGRRTEMIKTGGATVSPAEIEVQLQACEPVRLARAVGLPDDRREEIVVLCVELKNGATATEDGIRSFLRERLAGYKVPKRVLFFSEGELPMNRGGTKVKNQALLDLVQERLG